MAKQAGKSTTNLLRLVQERAICKGKEQPISKEKENKKNKKEKYFVPDLPKDCIYKILMILPIESLQRSRFVCKPWFNMINNSLFVEAHLRRSEMVLIFLSKSIQGGTSSNENVFHVDDLLKSQPEPFSIFQRPILEPDEKFYMQFMEIEDGKSTVRSLNLSCLGKIRATCNGLILLEHKLKRGGSLVINPITRKMIPIPLGTISTPHNESFGFAFSSCTEEYRVVHLFRDESGYVGCEIITVGSRPWRVIDGPKYGLFGWFGNEPVFATGALHWVPHMNRSEYIVSLGVEDERFRQIPLPKSSKRYDRLVEMGGSLSFLNHVNHNQIDVWILKDLDGDWTMKHSITVGYVMDMVPVGCSRNNSEVLVFMRSRDKSLHTYDIEQQEMRKIEIMEGCFPSAGSYVPHINSLVSWKRHSDQRLGDI
ncbi:F-box domain [Macleaya cordata]|uniref:F-box domain n=1 Tax=Macleaya cordata TaxID=56857 RepID=A0A200Q000_MACCD|nr:F-box domain [Macleaya cordata]